MTCQSRRKADRRAALNRAEYNGVGFFAQAMRALVITAISTGAYMLYQNSIAIASNTATTSALVQSMGELRTTLKELADRMLYQERRTDL